jgi:tetratricopeptide (TPR) repeat protein
MSSTASTANRAPVSVSTWAWTREPWTGDEKPYRRLRAVINTAIAKKQLTAKDLQQYKAQAAKKPVDPQAQFRWGYAAYELMLRTANPQAKAQYMKGVVDALSFPASPRTYEYARLRFLLEARNSPDPNLIGLSKRLLQRNPRDSYVKYYSTTLLRPSIPAERKQAIAHARQMIQRDPKKAKPHSVLGGIYFRSWMTSMSQADANQAIAAYRQYLKLAPPADTFRKSAEANIRMIQTIQSRRAKR